MQLQVILRNKGIIVDKEISFVSVQSQNGEIGILNNHAPLIAPLKKTANLKYKLSEDSENTIASVEHGFVEIQKEDNKTKVIILCEKYTK